MVNLRMTRREYVELYKSRRSKPTKLEQRAIFDRVVKRVLKAQGVIGPKIPSLWDWVSGEQSGRVTGHTRSDARAEIKKTLGKKLPSDLIITKAAHVE